MNILHEIPVWKQDRFQSRVISLTNSDNQTISDAVRSIRHSLGFSVEIFAQRLEVAPVWLEKLETGMLNYCLEQDELLLRLSQIAIYAGISVYDLLCLPYVFPHQE